MLPRDRCAQPADARHRRPPRAPPQELTERGASRGRGGPGAPASRRQADADDAVRAQGRPRRRGRRRPDQRVGGRGAATGSSSSCPRDRCFTWNTRLFLTASAPAAPRSLPPAASRAVRGTLPLAEAYVARLAGDGVTRGLIGPRERARLWDRHMLNCAAVAPLIPADAAVGDVGSGAGLPGIVARAAAARRDGRCWSSRCCAGRPSWRRSSRPGTGPGRRWSGPGRGARRRRSVRRGDRPRGRAA